MRGPKKVNNGLNMTSTALKNDSGEIRSNDDANLNPSSVTQVLTNACIIVPTICFVGAVMAVLLGVTICKISKSCECCACLKTQHIKPEEAGLREPRAFWERIVPVSQSKDTSDRSLLNNLHNSTFRILNEAVNPTFDSSSHSAQNPTEERICLRTFNNQRHECVSDSPDVESQLDSSYVSQIVNCSQSYTSELSLAFSSVTRHERLQRFISDAVVCSETYKKAHDFRTHNKNMESDRSSMENLNTPGEDISSFSECEESSTVESSSIYNHPCSELSKLANVSPFLRSFNSLPVTSSNESPGYIHFTFSEDEQCASHVQCQQHKSCILGSLYAPPPTPNTDASDQNTQEIDIVYLNENPWLTSTKKDQNTMSEGQTQAYWTTAQSEETGDRSLEWDGYAPSLTQDAYSCQTFSVGDINLVPLSEKEYWV